MTRRATRRNSGAAFDALLLRAGLRRFLPDRLDEVLEKVDVVVVVLALQHRRDALEAHAGVDRGTREVDAVTRTRAARTA